MESSLQFEKHWENIANHYQHAKEKHPVFVRTGAVMVWRAPETLEKMLDEQRARNEHGYDTADSILVEELLEQELALAQGDYTQAIYETYDCIAVLMRMIELMERKSGD